MTAFRCRSLCVRVNPRVFCGAWARIWFCSRPCCECVRVCVSVLCRAVRLSVNRFIVLRVLVFVCLLFGGLVSACSLAARERCGLFCGVGNPPEALTFCVPRAFRAWRFRALRESHGTHSVFEACTLHTFSVLCNPFSASCVPFFGSSRVPLT